MAAKKNKPPHMARPVADGWEVWSFSGSKGPTLVQTVKSAEEIKQVPNCILGLPIYTAFHVPVWLVRTEPEFLSELMAAQLEKRGLLQDSLESTIHGSDVTAMTDTHELHLISVIPNEVNPEIAPAWCEQFDLAARYYPYEGDAVYIWRELSQLAVAFVRQGRACHFQALQHEKLTTSALEEIQSLQLALEAQGVTNEPTQLRLFGSFDNEEMAAARDAFEGPTLNQPYPPPQLPSKKYDLTPGFVAAIKEEKKQKAATRRTITMAVAIYLAIFSLFGLYIAGLFVQKGFLAADLESKRPTVEKISNARAKWMTIESTIDPSYSALETLYQIALLLPEEGVRFTSFEMDDVSVTIQAEASSFPDAFNYGELIKDNPELELYTWETPNPVLLPNNKAQFQVLGRSIYAPLDIQ